MLVVSSTVGVLHGVHGHTTDLGPRVALHLVLVVCAACLEHRLVHAATTGNDADHSAAPGGKGHAGVSTRTHTTGSSLPASQVTYLLFTDFLAPEGRRILVLPESSLWATTVT